jgi:hypothetical protein
MIDNYHASFATYMMKSRKKILKLAEISLYATYFILLQRMIEVHASLQATVVSH